MVTNYSILRSRLENERKRLQHELAEIQAESHPTERREGSPFGKREEDATENLELEKRMTMERRLRDQLSEVEHALSKFEQGTYGRCENCHKPIDAARLEALPQATLCLKCKAGLVKGVRTK